MNNRPKVINKIQNLRKSIESTYIHFANESKYRFGDDQDALHQLAVASTMEATIQALMIVRGLDETSDGTKRVDARITEDLIDAIACVDGEITSAEVGSALESLRGKCLAKDANGNLIVRTSAEQRSRGVYFTPTNLAEAMLRPALKMALQNIQCLEDLRNFAILDPAAGCGAFLISALRISAELLMEQNQFSGVSEEQLRVEIASHCIYGVDLDPVAIATVRSLLIAEVGEQDWNVESLDHHLHIGDSISTSVYEWWKWFPERESSQFDVIATNPPWSKLRPLKQEFFEHIDSNVRLFQGTALGHYLKEHMGELIQDDWERYVAHTLQLSKTLRESDEYVVNQKSFGDPDLYKFFLERSISLLAPRGIAALLLPSAILRAQGSAPLRKFLRKKGEISVINEYINRKKIFDIHPMYRFSTILFTKGKQFEGTFAQFSRTQVEITGDEEFVYLSSDFLDLVGGSNALIPEVKSEPERRLLERIYSENPLSKSTFGEGLSFKRELDMTNDAANFIDAEKACSLGFKQEPSGRWTSHLSDDVLVPVYEGRMVHQYDNTAKRYIEGHGRSAKWEASSPGGGSVSPHFFVTESYAKSRGWKPIERVGYCEISGHANERTVLAAVIPAYAICGNKVPVLRGSEDVDSLLWLALANSLVIDWLMRRWVSTTVNQFYWRNIPTPNAMRKQDADFLKKAARKLSNPNNNQENPVLWLGHRAQLRAAIDAVVMNVFKFCADERDILIKDFPAFGDASHRGKREGIPLKTLLDIYSQAHLKGNLRVETVHAICLPEDCASTYATRDQAKYL
jgi:hypothetical protein